MASDDITQKHLNRLRIRGAPSTIPGVSGFVGSYDAEETWFPTGRALVLPLERHISAASLRDAYARLQETAKQQRLTVSDQPMFALKGDPKEDPPHKWQFEAVLAVRGPAKADGDITVTRLDGGMHIVATTGGGLKDLDKLYVFLLGKFLPSKKQELMRPYVLHQVIDGLDGRDDDLVISVFVPAVLSIKPVETGEGAEA